MKLDDAIIGALRTDSTLIGYLSKGAKAIGHGRVPSGTLAPYIILRDVGDVPDYTFGNTEVQLTAEYNVMVYTKDTPTESAQTIATRILERVYALLHNQEITVSGRVVLNCRYAGRIPTDWTPFGEKENYFVDGSRWHVVTGKS